METLANAATGKFADILIVCGQGIYDDGCFWSEYHDRDVYIEQALRIGELLERFRYTHVICSGGPTQPENRAISEAAGIAKIWDDFNARPRQPVTLDEFSLDSAENLYVGLMTARLELPGVPIRRIGISSAWHFKKPRFNLAAAALGIAARMYYHSYADEIRANAGHGAAAGERKQLSNIVAAGDYLLLSDMWEQKRKGRYIGKRAEFGYESRSASYESRLSVLRSNPRFMHVFAELELLRTSIDHGNNNADYDQLRSLFYRTVIVGD